MKHSLLLPQWPTCSVAVVELGTAKSSQYLPGAVQRPGPTRSACLAGSAMLAASARFARLARLRRSTSVARLARMGRVAFIARLVGVVCLTCVAATDGLAEGQSNQADPAVRLVSYERETAARNWLIVIAAEMLRRQQARLAAAGLAGHPCAIRLQAAENNLEGLVETLLAEQAVAAAEAWHLPSEHRLPALEEIRTQAARRLATLASDGEVQLCDICMAALTAGAARCLTHLALVNELDAAARIAGSRDGPGPAERTRDHVARAVVLARKTIRNWMRTLQSVADDRRAGAASTIATVAARRALAVANPNEIESLLVATATNESPLSSAAQQAWQKLDQLVKAAAKVLESPPFAAAVARERLLQQLSSASEREASLATLLDAADVPAGLSAERRRAFLDRFVAEQAAIRQLLLKLEPTLAEWGLQRDLGRAAAAADACLQAAFAGQLDLARGQHSEALAAVAHLVAVCGTELDQALAAVAEMPVQPQPGHDMPAHETSHWDALPTDFADRLPPPYVRPFPPGYGDRLRRYFAALPSSSP